MKISLEKKLACSFGAAVVVVLAISLAAIWNARRFERTVNWVEHTHRVLGNLSDVHTGLLRMQVNVRGFLLTGREEMLTALADSKKNVAAGLVNLRSLVADNPGQAARLESLAAAVGPTTATLDELVRQRQAGGFDPAQAAPTLTRGQGEMRAMRATITAMEAEEQRLLAARGADTTSAASATLITAAISGVVAIAVVIGAGLIVRRDFLARRAAESALRLSEQDLRQTLGSIADYAIMRLDAKGTIQSWNPGAEKILGYAAAEIVGQSIAKFYPADDQGRGRMEHELREAATTGRFEEENWRVRRDGTPFWANVILTDIRDHDNRLIGFVKITGDLTARRTVEEQIRQLNHDLLLQNDRLAHANKELESFSYSVSHDLRAPLRHIDGFASLLTKHAASSLDAKGQRYVGVIAESAQRMGRLIDDLLTFSRMGRAQMEFAELDHAQLVAAVIRDGSFDRNPKIQWRIAPLPRVRGDAAMLRQVWSNLIDNAVKYSARSASPRIEIEGEKRPETREQIFHIRDNGVGFDMKYADKLFGVFQRLHAQADFDGTGIGLANVQRIVTRHGGRAWGESTPGQGATFSFSIPDDRPSHPNGAPPA